MKLLDVLIEAVMRKVFLILGRLLVQASAAKTHRFPSLSITGWGAKHRKSIEEDAMTDKQRVQDIQRQLTELTAACRRRHVDAEYERCARS